MLIRHAKHVNSKNVVYRNVMSNRECAGSVKIGKKKSELDVNANVVKSNHYSHQIDRNTVKPKFTMGLMVFKKQCDHTKMM